MKRVLLIVFLVFISGCGHLPVDTPVEENAGSPPEASEPEYGTTVIEPEKDSGVVSNSETKKFLTPKGALLFDEWIYYIDYSFSELWKCEPDLSINTLVLSSGFGRKITINPDGFIVYSNIVESGMWYEGHPDYKPSRSEYYIYNVFDGSSVKIDLPSIGTNYYNMMLYKNSIYLLDHNNGYKIEVYDLKGNYIKTICDESVDNFAIIDDAVYFMPCYKNAEKTEYHDVVPVMRFNISSGTTEKLFEFDIVPRDEDDYMSPGPVINFDDRNVIINRSRSSLMYTSVDEIEPKEIAIDFANSMWDIASYMYSDDDDLYFCLYYIQSAESVPYASEIYKVAFGTKEPVFIKPYDGRDSVLFIDGYQYYYELDDNNKVILRKEKF